MRILSLVCIVLGVCLFVQVMVMKYKVPDRKKALILILVLLFAGIGTLVATDYLCSEDQYRMWMILFGAVILIVGINGVLDVKRCNIMIPGVCMKMIAYSSRRVHVYAPVFQYTYNNQSYENQSPQSVENINEFKIGDTYTIYLCNKNPNRIIFRNVTSIKDIWIIVAGIGIMLSTLVI